MILKIMDIKTNICFRNFLLNIGQIRCISKKFYLLHFLLCWNFWNRLTEVRRLWTPELKPFISQNSTYRITHNCLWDFEALQEKNLDTVKEKSFEGIFLFLAAVVSWWQYTSYWKQLINKNNLFRQTENILCLRI